MKENTFYFPHDVDASEDPKCCALLSDFGFSGYGLYWALVELLHKQNGKITKFPKLFEGLAYRFNITKPEIEKLVRAMLDDYKLLEENDEYIWCPRVQQNLEDRNKKYEAKVEAGRRGGLESGASRKSKLSTELVEAN